MKESQFVTTKIKPLLAELRFKVKKHAEKFSTGWPDLSAVHFPDGRTIYIEAKVAPNECTKLQFAELRELAQYGADCYIITLMHKPETTYIEKVEATGEKYWIPLQTFIDKYKGGKTK